MVASYSILYLKCRLLIVINLINMYLCVHVATSMYMHKHANKHEGLVPVFSTHYKHIFMVNNHKLVHR